jgi:hypothetical protein
LAVLDRLFGRTRSGTGPTQCFGGVVRLGGTYYNAKWTIIRALNEVYANPTGYRCRFTGAADLADVANTPIHMDSGIKPMWEGARTMGVPVRLGGSGEPIRAAPPGPSSHSASSLVTVEM